MCRITDENVSGVNHAINLYIIDVNKKIIEEEIFNYYGFKKTGVLTWDYFETLKRFSI